MGVVISHPHQDHYGLAYRLPKETLFLIGKAAEGILVAADVFSPAGLLLENVPDLEDRTSITLGPSSITPYLVDHSTYDAYAVLVEADGVGLFYTGDLRAHGRKPNERDLIKPDGLGVRRDGSFCVLEVKGPKDDGDLIRATLQGVCGVLAVYAKRKMIFQLTKCEGGLLVEFS